MKISRKILFITIFIICISVNLVYARTGKVKIEAARVRQEANTASTIVTIIYEGDEVEILEESGEWCKIKYKNDTGYVKKDFLSESNTSATNKNQTNTASQATNKNQTNVVNTTNTVNTANANTTNTVSKTTNKVPENTVVSNNAASSTSSTDNPVDENTLIIASETYAKLLPNFSSNNIVKFEVSKQVKKISELNNWIQVTDNENTGWILKSRVQTGTQTSTTVERNKPENTVAQNTVSNTSNIVENKTNTTNTVTNTSNTTNTTSSNTTATSSANSNNKKGTITVETAIVRKEATTSSEIVDFLDYGDEISIVSQEGEWYKITFKDITGYVKNTLLKVSDSSVSSRSLTDERQEKPQTQVSASKSSEVADYAKQYLGYSYVVGGKDPNSGFDCSGFTKYIYAHFGYTLGSTAASQNNIGTEISRDNLIPGDLILFLNEEKTKIGHTGVYVGSGEFVHAANPQRGVVTDNLNTNSYYNERFVTAKRIVD